MNGLGDVPVVNSQENNGNVCESEIVNQRVDEIFMKVDQFTHKVKEVEQFYSGLNTKQLNTPKGGVSAKDKEKFASFKRRQQASAHKDSASSKRMQELIRQLGIIIRQITQHKWAEPFMQPVNVVGLGLHDYYEIIEKPMDFSTIKRKMEARGGSGYMDVRDICTDVRLIFKNAMKYNDEREDVHVMAKTLLDKFETKWLQLLPKIDEEEKRLKDEAAEMQFDVQLAQEASHAKVVKELGCELEEVDAQLEELREMILQMCRKMTTEEKKRLGSAITRLSPENINKALEIVAKSDPNFQATGETVEVDIDAQSESTLWKLKFFVKDTLQAQMKGSPKPGANNNNQNNKRKICDALAKSSTKKKK